MSSIPTESPSVLPDVSLKERLRYYLLSTPQICDLEPLVLLNALGATSLRDAIKNPDKYHRLTLRYLFLSLGAHPERLDEALGLLVHFGIEPFSYLEYLVQGAARYGNMSILSRFPDVQPLKRLYWLVAGSEERPGTWKPRLHGIEGEPYGVGEPRDRLIPTEPHPMVLRGMIARGAEESLLRSYIQSGTTKAHPPLRVFKQQEWEDVLSEAAKRGRMGILRWLLEDWDLLSHMYRNKAYHEDSRQNERTGTKIRKEFCTHLAAQGAKGGHSEIVEYMNALVPHRPKSVLSYAMEGGNLDLVTALLGSRLGGMYSDGVISFIGYRNYSRVTNLLLDRGAEPTFIPRLLIEGEDLETIKRIITLLPPSRKESRYFGTSRFSTNHVIAALYQALLIAISGDRRNAIQLLLQAMEDQLLPKGNGTTRVGGEIVSELQSLWFQAIPGGRVVVIQELFQWYERMGIVLPTSLLSQGLTQAYRYRQVSLVSLLSRVIKARGSSPHLSGSPHLCSLREEENLLSLLQLTRSSGLSGLPTSPISRFLATLRFLPDVTPMNKEIPNVMKAFLLSVLRRLNRCRSLQVHDWRHAFSELEITILQALGSRKFHEVFTEKIQSVYRSTSYNPETLLISTRSYPLASSLWSHLGLPITPASEPDLKALPQNSVLYTEPEIQDRRFDPSSRLIQRVQAFIAGDPIPPFRAIGYHVLQPRTYLK